MATLEELQRGVKLAGIVPNATVTVVDVKWHGDGVVELTYKDEAGGTNSELLYRTDEARLGLLTENNTWTFDADGETLRLVSEANRIRLAYLFDAFIAVHTSVIEPLPHQITAVYGEMLPRQPLHFLLADDPGAGKTIMAGLLIKELMVRGDVERCLICAPGQLVEQWQDELQEKFGLPFEIMTRERIENSPLGNAFDDPRFPCIIARLDQMARSDDVKEILRRTDWDFVVCDEAHKMSAHRYGRKVQETKRYQLGELLRDTTRHFLLMTATPHSGKPDDFALFMKLIDPERFETHSAGDGHPADASDLMRRMVKEDLVRFDRTPLFPERKAYTVSYELSDAEKDLYEGVTRYVTEEMNRAQRLRDGRRGNNVGFALTVLQRRLASSSEAIYRSLERRRKRLEAQLAECKRQGYREDEEIIVDDAGLPDWSDEEGLDDFYDGPEDETTSTEEEVVDRATAARTIEELAQEIDILRGIESQARRVRQIDTDKKWEELSELLQDRSIMLDAAGSRRKLIIFTEHRDTLRYLHQKTVSLLGQRESVVIIHGGLRREERRRAQEAFTNDPRIHLLLATDAAGEGINLQKAHLMVNYDLPWNPNRIEQRFGRIHRIGQTEVCHLWNLVASDTREGAVYQRLLEKLEQVSEDLGGRVFDVLGRAFRDRPLRDMLIEAIRYGDQPEVRERQFRQVDSVFDLENIRELLRRHALTADHMAESDVQAIKEQMERAEARRLQPHFIRSFFRAAFEDVGGRMAQRETGRYEVTRVPAALRNWRPRHDRGAPVLDRYERICFEKDLVNVLGKTPAALVCPGHPLLEAVIDATLERHRGVLRQGAVLVDPDDESEIPRALVYLEHEIVDGRRDRHARRHVVSRRMEFVEIGADGSASNVGYAPYLDYEPLRGEDRPLIADVLEQAWVTDNLEGTAQTYAIQYVVPEHMAEVKTHTEAQVDKTLAAVRQRLTAEIAYWDRRTEELKTQELAGKKPRLNSGQARVRADKLQARLEARETELARQRNLSNRPPVVTGAALVVPIGLLNARRGQERPPWSTDTEARRHIERLAVEKVMETEHALGHEPEDVGVPGNPWDIESRDPETGDLFFIEVKGRAEEADTVCVTKNEILTAMNKPDHYILAIVKVRDGQAQGPWYIRNPFEREPDFGVTSANYSIAELLTRADEPR